MASVAIPFDVDDNHSTMHQWGVLAQAEAQIQDHATGIGADIDIKPKERPDSQCFSLMAIQQNEFDVGRDPQNWLPWNFHENLAIKQPAIELETA